MIGVILAAGMAKRLRPLTDACPKCLLKIGERTLLQRTVDAMIAAGINELVVVTGYRAEMIRDFLTEKYLSPLTSHPSPLEIHFIHNADYEHNNNIFSLWMTRPYTEGKDFLLSDSDILFDPQLIRAVLAAEGNALALNRHECGEEEIKVIMSEPSSDSSLRDTPSASSTPPSSSLSNWTRQRILRTPNSSFLPSSIRRPICHTQIAKSSRFAADG